MKDLAQPGVHAGEIALVQPGLVVALEDLIRQHQLPLEGLERRLGADPLLLGEAAVDRDVLQVVGMVGEDGLVAQLPGKLGIEAAAQRPGLGLLDELLIER